ncbi:GatB/YqeY domain-containing protein [Candidatus Falkowbacteria bacterium]|nr:GatB/YqeY domain-containing protein [Candidatus Falkowbacteria bacterium]
MSLKGKIEKDLTEAQKTKEETKVSTLRMLNAALKNEEIKKKGDLDEAQVIEIIAREAKKRREAIESYKAGGRGELAEKEERELKVLTKYLPEQLSHDKIKEAVEEAIKKTGAKGPSDFGKVMGVVMGKLKGRADGAEVQGLVKERLG